MKTPPRIWQPSDWITALLAAGFSLAVYVWSAAPNVTLLDSGEFIVAAQHFGVPHPTGYPLWTLLAWLFQLLPLGNAAWEVNIFSGLCAALAVGLTAALLSSILRWCLPPVAKNPGVIQWLPQTIALAFTLMLAFSQSMWSQAVIAEVYALHALLVVSFLTCCYLWVRHPSRDFFMLLAFFSLALAFSNHHLIITLAPLPYLLILLLRRRMMMDWIFAGILTVLLVYLGFAILSQNPAVLKTSLRFFYCVALAFGIFAWVRRGRIRWRFIAFLPLAVALGLLPYLYMPLASSTNPPMNWSYARTPAGFYFSINRSQYSGSLSDLSLKSLGRLMGSYGESPTLPAGEALLESSGMSFLQEAQLWVGFFWLQLSRAFTPLAAIGYFASILFVFRFSLDRRVWIYLLHLAFVLAAFFQPLTMDAKSDNAGWWLQMPFHTYTNLIYALLSGLGIGLLIEKIHRKYPAAFWIAPIFLLLPILTFIGSEPSSSQRGHWFGWDYGHDMLKDLPQGSLMIGGSDAGRFVPTYMILGESPQGAKVKRDPDFDRRDLTIITQNALGEPNYMQYLRDQYTTARPAPKNGFERWLGRDTIYPQDRILLPDQKQIDAAIKAMVEDLKNHQGPEEDKSTVVFASVLKWIWENNREDHDFFVEESFPITWTYDYAIPHGLIYQINKTKVEKLTPEMVAKDFAFWKDYTARLLGNPHFRDDIDAQRSFSKLRQTMGNIYRYREMIPEATKAYQEALEIWPDNVESQISLMNIAWAAGDFETPIQLYARSLENDPNNFNLWRLRFLAEQRRDAQEEINGLVQTLKSQPKSRETLRKLLNLYANVGDTNAAAPLMKRALADFPNDADMLREIISVHERNQQFSETADAAKQLTKIESTNINNYLLLARAYFFQNKKAEFYATAAQAVSLGGEDVKAGFRSEPIFASWTNEPEFQALVKPSPLAQP